MFSTSSSLFKHSVSGIIKRLQTKKFRFKQFDKGLNYKCFSKSSAKTKAINGKNSIMPAQNNKNKTRSVLTGIGLVSATFAANVYSNQVLATPSSTEDGIVSFQGLIDILPTTLALAATTY